MSFPENLRRLSRLFRLLGQSPGISVHDAGCLVERAVGARFAAQWQAHSEIRPSDAAANRTVSKSLDANPLAEYLAGVCEGRGIQKWLHYSEVYHRHLRKFTTRDISVVEVGVHSGGSLAMWRRYFGERCHIHGIDVHEECKIYQDAHTTIHIGDQADREFWRRFRNSVPSVDVLIDDGGHAPHQQIVTLEEMLPHLRPGGVYICEDIHGTGNHFSAYTQSLADCLNALIPVGNPIVLKSISTPFQDAIHSIHHYPFMVVVEMRDVAAGSFVGPRQGAEWQPF